MQDNVVKPDNNVINRKDTALEHQGTKCKFWIDKKLFKVGKVHGENWAEILSYKLSKLLDIPAAEYEPVTFFLSDKLTRGTLSPNFVGDGERLINANELLSGWLGTEYDQTKRYKHKAYTFSRSLALFKVLKEQIQPKHSLQPVQQMIGYLIFDVFIGNQDRHHENWGFISSLEGSLYLAPSYDHGASLACRLLEKERKNRLVSQDKGYQIKHFAQKANSAFYDSERLLKTYKLAELCIQKYPKESFFWIEKIRNLTQENLLSVVDTLDDSWMNSIEKEFTLKLLQTNQKYLAELQNRYV